VQIPAGALLFPNIIIVINFLLLAIHIQDFTAEPDIPATVTLQMADLLSTGNAQQMDNEYVGGGICG